MKMKDTIGELKKYNKWRRGSGKKYSQPGFPFSPTAIGIAIDNAVRGLTQSLPDDEFRRLTEMASLITPIDSFDRKVIRDAKRIVASTIADRENAKA